MHRYFERITLSSDYCESSLGRELPLFVWANAAEPSPPSPWKRVSSRKKRKLLDTNHFHGLKMLSTDVKRGELSLFSRSLT